MERNDDKITTREIVTLIIHFPRHIIRKKQENKKIKREIKEEKNKRRHKLTLHDFAEYFLMLNERNKTDWFDKIGWIVVMCLIIFLIFY